MARYVEHEHSLESFEAYDSETARCSNCGALMDFCLAANNAQGRGRSSRPQGLHPPRRRALTAAMATDLLAAIVAVRAMLALTVILVHGGRIVGP